MLSTELCSNLINNEQALEHTEDSLADLDPDETNKDENITVEGESQDRYESHGRKLAEIRDARSCFSHACCAPEAQMSYMSESGGTFSAGTHNTGIPLNVLQIFFEGLLSQGKQTVLISGMQGESVRTMSGGDGAHSLKLA